MEDRLGNRPADAPYTFTLYYIYTKFTANCLYISDFWRLRSQTTTGISPLDPAGALPSSRPPVLTLTSKPGYATDRNVFGCANIFQQETLPSALNQRIFDQFLCWVDWTIINKFYLQFSLTTDTVWRSASYSRSQKSRGNSKLHTLHHYHVSLITI